MATQFPEELLEVRQRNLLPLADSSERHWTVVLAHGQIDHGGHSETAFGGQTHDGLRNPE
jgi:hypothetical protein